MKYYMLSGMDKENNYNFYANIAKIFKEDLVQFRNIVYIPTYPENKEKCEKLAKKRIFENIGVYFEKKIVLNNSYNMECIKDALNNNELFFLYGGNPYKQINFINRMNIDKLIKNKTIIGLSAGSINMCKKAICSKDDEFKESRMYSGMGLVDFSFEPHFNIENEDVLVDLKRFSNETEIYALEDDAYIIVENGKVKTKR